VLARIGQALLDDAVDLPAEPRRRLQAVQAGPQLHRPGDPGLLDERAEVRQRRLRRDASIVLAKHPEHAAQLVERLLGRPLDHLRLLADLLPRQVLPEGERAGVHRQQRDPVRKHVMHLAGDPGPLGGPRLASGQRLLAVGRLGPQAPGLDELTTSSQVEAERDGAAGEEGEQDTRQPPRRGVPAGVDPLVDQRRGEAERADPGDLAPTSPGGNRDQAERPGAARERGDCGEQGDRDGDAQREAPMPDQQQQGERPEAHEVEEEQGVRALRRRVRQFVRRNGQQRQPDQEAGTDPPGMTPAGQRRLTGGFDGDAGHCAGQPGQRRSRAAGRGPVDGRGRSRLWSTPFRRTALPVDPARRAGSSA
jgi:hypothetical protein